MSKPTVDDAGQGRPQNAELSEKILEETLRQLSPTGYADLRIEAIAKVVGCGKAAIYRRWSGKAELVASALAAASVFDDPGSGHDVTERLFRHAWVNVENQRRQGGGTPNRNGWGAITDLEVREHFWELFLHKRRELGLKIIQDAVDDGQFPIDIDANGLLDALAGFVLYRHTVRGAAVTEDDLRSIVRALTSSPPILAN